MGVLLTNVANTALAAGITNVATSLTVLTGAGALFPVIASPGDYFYVTLDGTVGIEITLCTARAGDTLTVTRAQEGTTGLAFLTGDTVALRVTAQTLRDLTAPDQPLLRLLYGGL